MKAESRVRDRGQLHCSTQRADFRLKSLKSCVPTPIPNQMSAACIEVKLVRVA